MMGMKGNNIGRMGKWEMQDSSGNKCRGGLKVKDGRQKWLRTPIDTISTV